ncbi:hypothetical protein SAMN05216597_3340 [Pseudomonas cannabina]|nr:hypothetical protein SAMN05216597_3340 [Pseudomonas cannabina]
MRSEILTATGVRMLRKVVGTVLLLAGMALLAERGVCWLSVWCWK